MAVSATSTQRPQPVRPTAELNRLAGTQAARPTPLPTGQENKAYDGTMVGGDGNAYPPGSTLASIPPVRPQGGATKPGTVIFVNGMGESRGHNKNHLQAVANKTGMNVVGVYNATDGTVKDLIQCLKDKKDIGTNHAVDALASTVYQELKAGREVKLLAHSQGGIITNRALVDVKNRLMLEDGLSPRDAERVLSGAKVVTMGAASSTYPDGPKYSHYVNRADLVPMAFGLGRGGDAGKGAQVHKFGFPNPFGIFRGSHDTATYFKQFKGFPA